MLNNLFKRKIVGKTVHCEITGGEASLEDVKVLTKITGVINIKAIGDAQVDDSAKVIYSERLSPMKYFSKLYIPPELHEMIGDLYTTVEDYGDLDQSTAILSNRGLDLLMGRQVVKLIDYLNDYEVIQFPETMFWVTADPPQQFKTQTKKCEGWDVEFVSIGKKYMAKKILKRNTEKQTFGFFSILLPPYDVAVGDCSEKNPNGTGYMYQTDRNFMSLSLCCNESAVDYCKSNNVLVYYNDFLNAGKLRILTEHTVSINSNLQNGYKFRSLNI